MRRVNIPLSDEAHTRAKIIALLSGRTLNSYLRQAVEEALERDRQTLEEVPR